ARRVGPDLVHVRLAAATTDDESFQRERQLHPPLHRPPLGLLGAQRRQPEPQTGAAGVVVAVEQRAQRQQVVGERLGVLGAFATHLEAAEGPAKSSAVTRAREQVDQLAEVGLLILHQKPRLAAQLRAAAQARRLPGALIRTRPRQRTQRDSARLE